MHYSDCYSLLKKARNKKNAIKLDAFKQRMEQLESEVNQQGFFQYVKRNKNSGRALVELRQIYDNECITLVIHGIENLLQDPLFKDMGSHRCLTDVQKILQDIKKTAEEQHNHIRDEDACFYSLIRQYASHFLPFDQSYDPFKGSDFIGYCWGHTHRYGKLVSQESLEQLSVASDRGLYHRFRANWTYGDTLLRRKDWYFVMTREEKIRKTLWAMLSRLDDQSVFNFNFLVSDANFHSTGLRMAGNGIEYYETNYGLIRFDSRENAVNFLTYHLLNKVQHSQGEICWVKLPYPNKPYHDPLVHLPAAKIERQPDETMNHNNKALDDAIGCIQAYGQQLKKNTRSVKAHIKANEIEKLVEKFASSAVEHIAGHTRNILANKKHSLMLNRGTGLYFFKRRCKSRSTTQDLLEDIYRASQLV
ncbi:hypothetical protein [Legionella spiritensis]|uniref:hypothetical protein n=1 Tax=Legionella spiritensis TaxID=452 RepID=UPI000F718F15|nr:hypothetical protein [Legionella spiritensis]VEG91609.1 Uncharacterised protein [Legionella spiritensis]